LIPSINQEILLRENLSEKEECTQHFIREKEKIADENKL